MESQGKISFSSAARALAIGFGAAVSGLSYYLATQQDHVDDTVAVAILATIFTLACLGILGPPAWLGVRRRLEIVLMSVIAVGMLILIAAVFASGYDSGMAEMACWFACPLTVLAAGAVIVVRALAPDGRISFWSAVRAVAIAFATAFSVLFFYIATQQTDTQDRIAAAMPAAIFTLAWLGILGPAALVGTRRRHENTFMAIIAGGMLLLIAGVILNGYIDNGTGAIVACWYICPMVMLLVIGRARWLYRNRQRDATTLLLYVEQAVRLNLPLAQAMSVAAAGESRAVASRLALLRERLEQGQGIDTALREAAPELPRETICSLSAALSLGRLPQTLRRLLGTRATVASSPTDPTVFYEAYPFAVLTVLAAVAGIFLMYVVPRYQGIMNDFHATFPFSTRLVLSIFSNQWLLVVWVSISTIALLWAFSSIFFGKLRWFEWGWRIRDEMVWWIPLARAYARDQGLAALCRAIADGATAGLPLDDAVAQAARMQPNAVIARRAAQWSAEIQSGRPMPQAAREAGFPKLISAMLATVRDEQGLAAVMIYLSQFYEFRFARTRTILRAVYVPAVVLVMGSMVALLALSVFQPMIVLIQMTSNYRGGL
jgi:general secretion pathway protein F